MQNYKLQMEKLNFYFKQKKTEGGYVLNPKNWTFFD